jgi:pilus assembly protein CpaC
MKTHLQHAFLFGFAWLLSAATAIAQAPATPQRDLAKPAAGIVEVAERETRLEMIINSSQILQLDGDVARANVHNDALLEVKPVSRNQMLVSAKATGFSQVDLYTPDGTIYNVQVTVTGDARELESILQSEFPSSTISVRPIQGAVIMSGSVTSDVHVASAVQIAQQYFPVVINRIEVLGVHTVQLKVQLMEVSRTKLRQCGVDWAAGFGDDFVQQSVAGLVTPGGLGTVGNAANETFKFGVVNGGNDFFFFVRMLKQNNLVKVLADPTLTALDGRPASFNVGGEFPVIVPAGLGQVGVEFREFGTRLDYVAKVRADGMIHLEVRPMISEVDESRAVLVNGISVPGLRSRYVETAVDLRAGQTLAVAGLLQQRTEARTTGLPGLSDLPYVGVLFRDVREVQNEVELLIMVTPDFAAGLDPTEVPQTGPGLTTDSPNDKELYLRGYIEVPNTCIDNSELMQGQGAPVMEISQPINEGESLYQPSMDQSYFPADVGATSGLTKSDNRFKTNPSSSLLQGQAVQPASYQSTSR